MKLVTEFNAKWGNYNTVTCLRLLANGTKYTLTDIFIAMSLGVKKKTHPRTVLLLCYVIVFWFGRFYVYLYFGIFILLLLSSYFPAFILSSGQCVLISKQKIAILPLVLY